MAIDAAQSMRREPPAIFSLAFRPFFLAASVWSAVALIVWVGMLAHGATLGTRFDPMSWHIHEMLFGFVLAAIAGFMLTAIPNWTGRPAVRGLPLAGLVALWLLGRVASLTSAWWPFALASAADLAFPVALFLVALREIVLGRNWRNLVMPVPIAVLGIADLAMHLRVAGVAVPTGLGWRLGVAAIIVLISVIAGRIIPAFTRNWLAKRGETKLPGKHSLVDKLALGSLHIGLLGWAFIPAFRPVGWLLLVASVFNLARLSRWRGVATLSEPLLWILHLGYLWVVVGAALLGASLLGMVPLPASIHALTAGAIGTMVLAVMTRVSLGHSGRPLTADRVCVAIYVLITATAVVRVAAGFIGGVHYLHLIELSGGLWAASFLTFAIGFGSKLVLPRPVQVSR